MDAIIDPANSAFVGGISLLIGAFGLIITLIGFGIALFQIKRTMSAALAAKNAASAIQVRVSRYEIAVDLSEAKTSLRHAKYYADLEAWPQFVTCCENATEAIGRVILQEPFTGLEISARLKRSKSKISGICNTVEKFLDGASPQPKKSEISKRIRQELGSIQSAEQINLQGALA